MGSFRGAVCVAVAVLLLFLSCMVGSSDAWFGNTFNTWTPKGCNVSLDESAVALTLNDPIQPYAGVATKDAYLYGSIGAWMKLVPNNSAGTVTTLYLSSSGPKHCEFDFEFLGNSSGKPYILHTNIFVDGVGGREIQFNLWFDPTLDFHYYYFQWNANVVVFFIDKTPIRMFGNYEFLNAGIQNTGIQTLNSMPQTNSTMPQNNSTVSQNSTSIPLFLYPKRCPMNLYLSIWDGSQWATQGGRVKLNWTEAPFTAHYKRFSLNGCRADQYDQASIAACQSSPYANSGLRLNRSRRKKLRWVRDNCVHYNYCTDTKRFLTPPPECKYNVL